MDMDEGVFTPIKVQSWIGTFEVVLVEGDREGHFVPAISPLETTLMGETCMIELKTQPGVRVNPRRRGEGYGLGTDVFFRQTSGEQETIGEVDIYNGRVRDSWGQVEERPDLQKTPFEIEMRSMVQSLLDEPGFEDNINLAIAGAEKAALRLLSAKLHRQADEIKQEAIATDADADEIYSGPRM